MNSARILQQNFPIPVLGTAAYQPKGQFFFLTSGCRVSCLSNAALRFDHNSALHCKSASGRLCSLSLITIFQFLPDQEDAHLQISPLFRLGQHQGIKTATSHSSQRGYEETPFCCHNKASNSQYFTKKNLLLQAQQSSYLSLHT